MEVKKLNEELVEKEQGWQERVNLIRRNWLEEQQESRRVVMEKEQKYEGELEGLRIKISTINQEFLTAK